MTIKSHKDLEVWQKAMSFVTVVYASTENYPQKEIYGLTNQIRRAAISIPSNIAEGRSKRSTRDYMRYINIAYGSAAELETQLMISQNLGYLSSDQVEKLLVELSSIARMLNGMHSGLERKLRTET